MNLNLISYAIFFPAMVFIAVRVAQLCHTNGRVWMMRIFVRAGNFPPPTALVDAVNNVLLVCCYVVNAGYVALVVSLWEPVTSVTQMLAVLSTRIALILFTLAGLHYFNITVLLVWSHRTRSHRATVGSTAQPTTDNQYR
ncbi:MAG: hypothetical protein ABI599_09480 [Flavobacteriales bacterium]